MNIEISILTSIIYWLGSNNICKISYLNVYKTLSIILLLKIDELMIKNMIVIYFYLIGDLIIYFREETKSLFFFGIGHIIFLTKYLQNISSDKFLISLIVAYLICTKLNKNNKLEIIIYTFYIQILEYYLIIPILHGNFGTISFVLSDIFLGFGKGNIKYFTWPLYYLSIIYMINFE